MSSKAQFWLKVYDANNELIALMSELKKPWSRIRNLSDELSEWLERNASIEGIEHTPLIDSIVERGVWVTLLDREIRIPEGRKNGKEQRKHGASDICDVCGKAS